MGFLNGDYTPHPNSFYFNTLPVFWPFKLFWFFRKVSPQQHHIRLRLTLRPLLPCRLVRSSSSRTSPLPPRATPTSRDPVTTSASPSSTELAASNLERHNYSERFKPRWPPKRPYPLSRDPSVLVI